MRKASKQGKYHTLLPTPPGPSSCPAPAVWKGASAVPARTKWEGQSFLHGETLMAFEILSFHSHRIYIFYTLFQCSRSHNGGQSPNLGHGGLWLIRSLAKWEHAIYNPCLDWQIHTLRLPGVSLVFLKQLLNANPSACTLFTLPSYFHPFLT